MDRSVPRGAEARLLRGFGRLAAACSVVGALSFPLFWFAVGYRSLVSALGAEVAVNADIVSRVINANPEMWQFEQHRLRDILDRRPGVKEPEVRRIYGVSGQVIEEDSDSPPPPLVTRSEILYDAGACAGRFEISRSLRPLLRETAFAAAGGALMGGAFYAVIMLVPMRLLRRALSTLAAEKERSHVTLHALGEGVLSTGPDGRVELMNAVAERLTGWSAEEAAGRPLSEVYRAIDARTGEPLPDRLAHFREWRDADRVSAQAVQTSRTGRARRVADSAAPIRGSDGALQGMVVVVRDVTEQQRMEEELLKAQKLESVGVLAGGIAHDFNNILMAVLGNISLAMERLQPGSPARARLAEAGKACQRARDLTSQLLTFSRGGAPVRKTADLAAILREAAGFAMVGAKARCEIEAPGDLWPVDVGEGQVGQVVHNLVVNADQAMPAGGTIRIRAENVEVAEESGLPLPPGRYVRVSVRDEGRGIPAEHLASVFDPYFTTKREGSGLGLSVCFNVVRNHGGHITVRSEPGRGATFEFHLPASDGKVAAAGAEEAVAAGGAGRVLVMDDDEVIREVAGEMLRHLSYEPAFAADGAEAIERYREAISEGKPFAAVIMDLTIPGGMGGAEAVRGLLEIDPGARVIVSSGYSNDPVMADYRAHGFRGVAAKPYQIATLASVLSEVVGAPPEPAPGG